MVSPPEWLSQFVDSVAANIHSHDVLSPLGCHFQQVKEIWEVTLFASKTEIVGGSQDGLMCSAGFNVDVSGLVRLFSDVEAVSWQSQSLGRGDDLGAHLSVEGWHEDRQLWLRITSVAPRRFGVGRRAIVNQQQIEELW